MKRTVSQLEVNSNVETETYKAVEVALVCGGGGGGGGGVAVADEPPWKRLLYAEGLWVTADAVQRQLSHEYMNLEVAGALDRLSSGPNRKILLSRDDDLTAHVALIPPNHQETCKLLFSDNAPTGSTTMGAVRSLIFDEIAKCGPKGATFKQLKRTGIKAKVFNEAMADLQRAELVAPVVRQSGAKKTFICGWLKPHSSLVVPIWFDGKGQYDVEFREQLERIVTERVFAKSKVQAQGEALFALLISHVLSTNALLKAEELTDTDLAELLNLLVSERRLDRCGDQYFALKRPKKDQPPSTGLAWVVCSSCPYVDVCAPGGLISPENCQYFKRDRRYKEDALKLINW